MGKEISRRQARKMISRIKSKISDGGDVSHLNITAMMDMMSILLVFLLKQFSVEASAASMNESLQLPTSSIEASHPLAVNITITQNAVLVEGDGVTTVRAGGVDPSVKRDGANGYYITPLVDVLTKHANRLKKIAAMGGSQFDGTAMVLVDKNTPYRLLTEVLYSAGQAEFKNYHLVVIRKSQ